AGRVVRDQRIKRVHDEVKQFVGVQRSANRLGNVEQHAELVDYRQTCWCLNCFGHNQSTTLPPGNEISNWPSSLDLRLRLVSLPLALTRAFMTRAELTSRIGPLLFP